jgi:hypothetical protein
MVDIMHDDMAATRDKGGVSEETFDDFLAKLGALERAESEAIKEIISDSPSLFQGKS